MIGTLDQQTRLARVLITVADPLGQKSDVPPLILDTLIEAQIEGKPIDNVVRLRREYVHERDTVWVMQGRKTRNPRNGNRLSRCRLRLHSRRDSKAVKRS